MATLSNEPNGRRRIQFVDAAGKRRSVPLGRMSKRDAEAIKLRVEHLVNANVSGAAVDGETIRWLAAVPGKLHKRLARAGLIEERESGVLGPFIDRYIESRHDVVEGTRDGYRLVRRDLVNYFGGDKPLQAVSPGDAAEWWLELGKTLDESTVRRRCGVAKQFFGHAVSKRLIDANPFAGLKCSPIVKPEKFYFVSREETQLILDQCPGTQWRLIVALARYGGLRCPSELIPLRWGDINWERGRMLVRSPKTKRHRGKESRLVPLFPELLPYLEAAFDEAEEGTQYVVTRYRSPKINMREPLVRYIKQAGLKPWPKLFQNMRSTRETELAEQFPEHVVCAWLGNSQLVAAKHYLQLTDEHFERAAGKTVQKTVQNGAEYVGKGRNP